jgi:pimeloyl-ACP methyl ester carboxylesterase
MGDLASAWVLMCWSSCRRREGGLLLQLAIRSGVGNIPHQQTPALLASSHRASGRQRLAGVSMGGLGALDYAARHRGMFTVAASFSGIVHTRPWPGLPRLTDIRLLRVGRDPSRLCCDRRRAACYLGPSDGPRRSGDASGRWHPILIAAVPRAPCRWRGWHRILAERLRDARRRCCSRCSVGVDESGVRALGIRITVSSRSLGRSTRSTTRHRRVWPDVTA